MIHICKSFLLPAMIAGASATLAVSPASASGFLEQLNGEWRGKGTIYHKGSNPSKEGLACRIKAKYQAGSNSLAIDGRCGAASGTSRFSSVLKEDANGRISGKPILQRGELAKIALSGKASSKKLKLNGSNGKHRVYVSFFMTGDGKFQTVTGRHKGPKEVNQVVVNWAKQ